MSAEDIPADLRVEDFSHHIDMGFLNRRLCITALPEPLRDFYLANVSPGTDHMTVLRNDHLLVRMLLDACDEIKAPTLLEALALGLPKHLFRSTERLEACPEVYTSERVDHAVQLDLDFGKPVRIAYHTEHLVSSTGKMTLADGSEEGHVQSIVGLLHDKGDRFEIQPLVIGAPWFEDRDNAERSSLLMWMGLDYGEVLPEDIEQFSRMRDVKVTDASEWMEIMKAIPENVVKEAFASLLAEPTKKDWGGESNDHFSANVQLGGRRRTAAFLLKGPTSFREMTPEMCGKRGDQIYRLVNSGAELSVIQHSHLIGEAVRHTLRSMTVFPGHPRKHCFIDGQATYRILKAYDLLN